MKTLQSLILLLVFILFSRCAGEKYKVKESIDENGYSYETITNDPLKTRIYTLENGLKVYLSVNKDEPRIQTLTGVHAGSTYDPVETTGLAHYFEHMMFKGTDEIATIDWEKEKILLQEISDLFEKRRETEDPKMKEVLYYKIDSLSYEAAKYVATNEYDKIASSIGAKGTNAGTSYDFTVYINNIRTKTEMKGLSYDIRLFGPPLFPDNVGTSRKIRNKTIAFIAYLAYETRPISRDFLATLLWPFSGQSAARGNLRTVIHDAAKVLPQNAILSNSDTLQLSREHVSIDLWHFSDAVACLSEAPPPLDRLLAATEVCRGDFLEGFTLPDCSEFDSWQLLATDSIRSQLAFVLNGIVTARIKSGEVEKAVEPASRLVSLDPLEESSHRLMMEVYARCGRWAAAIGQYETCVRILADELDCEPDDETIRLVKEVRDRSKRFSEIRPESHFVMGRHQRPPVPSNRFFGRKHELEKIAGSLRSGTRLITVTGPAGIGKTRFATPFGLSAPSKQ